MDTIQHAAWGFVICRAVENSLGVTSASSVTAAEVACVALAALPDVIGAAEKIIKRDALAWKWYTWAHCLDMFDCPAWLRSIFMALRLLPPYALHLWMDKRLHDPFRRWWVWDELLWTEILGWTGIIIALGFIY